MMRRMFASSFGSFSSLLGLRRLDRSWTQTIPARNSLSPSSTVERPQPNTSSAVRALPSNNASVTSASTCRGSGHATRFSSRPANSTAHSGICLFSNRDFFMCLALFLVAHENTYKWYVSNYVIPKFLSLLLACTEPKQAVQNQSVLRFVGEGQGELFIGLCVEVKVVVPHVEVEHTVSLVGPNDWIIAAVPDFVGFRTGSQRVTSRVNGKQDFDAGVGPQVVGPFIPFVGGGPEGFRQLPRCRMPRILHAEDGGSRPPGIAREGPGPEKLLMVPIPVLRR